MVNSEVLACVPTRPPLTDVDSPLSVAGYERALARALCEERESAASDVEVAITMTRVACLEVRTCSRARTHGTPRRAPLWLSFSRSTRVTRPTWTHTAASRCCLCAAGSLDASPRGPLLAERLPRGFLTRRNVVDLAMLVRLRFEQVWSPVAAYRQSYTPHVSRTPTCEYCGSSAGRPSAARRCSGPRSASTRPQIISCAHSSGTPALFAVHENDVLSPAPPSSTSSTIWDTCGRSRASTNRKASVFVATSLLCCPPFPQRRAGDGALPCFASSGCPTTRAP